MRLRGRIETVDSNRTSAVGVGEGQALGGLDRARSSCVAPALLRGVGAGLSASTAAMLIRVVAVYREYPDNGEAGILGARGKA
jgi:hypothetical protein